MITNYNQGNKLKVDGTYYKVTVNYSTIFFSRRRLVT